MQFFKPYFSKPKSYLFLMQVVTSAVSAREGLKVVFAVSLPCSIFPKRSTWLTVKDGKVDSILVLA